MPQIYPHIKMRFNYFLKQNQLIIFILKIQDAMKY